jgi:hypothetical protein
LPTGCPDELVDAPISSGCAIWRVGAGSRPGDGDLVASTS